MYIRSIGKTLQEIENIIHKVVDQAKELKDKHQESHITKTAILLADEFRDLWKKIDNSKILSLLYLFIPMSWRIGFTTMEKYVHL